MSKLYLITGFLGAGKTTFLKRMLTLFSGNSIHVIVNEFGKVGVDGELLKEVGAEMEEITNGSIFCSCRLDQFEESLHRSLQRNPDVILVEASGLSDPTNIKRILERNKEFETIEFMGTICLVDAVSFPKVYETARVVKKQLNVSDQILLNKIDKVSEEEKESIKKILKKQCPLVPIHETVFGQVEPSWILSMELVEKNSMAEEPVHADITLRKFVLHIQEDTSLETLRYIWQMIMEDVYRMKGFIHIQNKWYLIDCAGNTFHAVECEGSNEFPNQLVVLSGYGLPATTAIKKAAKWYPEAILNWER